MILKNSCFKAFGLVGLAVLCSCGDDSASSTSVNESPENPPSAETPSDFKPSTEGETCSVENAFKWVAARSYEKCENASWVKHEVPVYGTGFNPSQFNFGAAWQASHEDAEFYKGVDYIAVWLGDNDFYNAFEARMVDMCIEINATPMIYGYVIAEFGKDMGLKDCDIAKEGEPSLCTDGASLIRNYFADSVLYRYKEYAEGLRDQIEINHEMDPNTFESIWLIEPDFYQYSQSSSEQNNVKQNDGGIPDAEMGALFAEIVSVIKTYLPAAKIAIDISPWALDQAGWYANFDMSLVDYASTSGGRSLFGSDKIKSGNKATWAGIATITGKPILADAGYDAGGEGTGHAEGWDRVDNIRARAADGVIGVMQMDAALDYPSRLDTIRVQLRENLIRE